VVADEAGAPELDRLDRGCSGVERGSALPRANSAISGFFFWGIRLEPVVWRSLSAMKPNSAEAHRMTSSLSLEMCMPMIAMAASASQAKSRSATASMLFAVGFEKPSSFATASRSSSMVEPAMAPDPSGQASILAAASARRPASRSSIST
jgi:hypothetical protein